MIATQLFRLSTATLALVEENEHRVAHTIPEGAIIAIPVNGLLKNDRLIDVEWEGQVVKMFTDDLRARTSRVTPIQAQAVGIATGSSSDH